MHRARQHCARVSSAVVECDYQLQYMEGTGGVVCSGPARAMRKVGGAIVVGVPREPTCDENGLELVRGDE